jgi:hypothetical protein
MQYLPLITKVGLSPTYDIIKGASTLTKSILTKPKSKSITKFMKESDLLFKFEVIKNYLNHVDKNTLGYDGLNDVIVEIETILEKIKRDLELNQKVILPFFRINVDRNLTRLEELDSLLKIRFELFKSVN